MTDSGLRFALLLDGKGGAEGLDWTGIQAWEPSRGVLWIHLDRTKTDAIEWLREKANLDPVLVDALLAEDTRPRLEVMGGGALVILRGVNLNPGAQPDDMVSIRIWVEESRIVSVRTRPLKAVRDIRTAAEKGDAPKRAGEIVANISERLVDNMGPVIAKLDDEIEGVEDARDRGDERDFQAEIADIRRRAVRLRRYIAPQREVQARLSREKIPWLKNIDRVSLRETLDQITRYLEDVDEAREHALITAHELSEARAERLTRNTYVISVIASVLIPLNLLAGMFGMNVGGVPFAKSDFGFWIMAAGFGIIALLGVFILRRLRWL